MNAIEVDHLFKTINGVPLLRDLHLRVAAGEAYGLIGPAGVGKSTLVHVLLGFLHADTGTVRVFGHAAPDAVRTLIGFVPERAAYHLRFQAREYLLYLGGMGRLSGRTLRRRVDEVLQQVGLATAAERSLSSFSRGMLQRLGIAQALLNRPPLLVLDDPLTMLLEQEQHELIDLLVSLRQQGQTMLVCTQYAQGLVYLCDRIGVLADGHIVAEATAHDLRAYANNVRLFLDQLTPALRQQLRLLSPAVTTSDNSVTLRPNNHRLQAQVLRILLDNGVTVLSLRSLENPLERFYVDAMRNTAMVRSGAIQSPPAPAAPPPPSYAPQAAPP
ncbi:MAG: ABC transporter ATP-binding protein, partial [Chloroflexaceae bacterium]|nr:ABC transporter ATP-binding protein [Chloroflexaceae bacterium]